MKNKLLLIIALITFSYFGFSQIANPPSNIEICDDNNDELASFDLTLVEPEVIGGQDPGELLISYYQTQADADIGINAIFDPTNYFNLSNPQTIFVRVELFSNGNFDTTSFIISVLTSPIPSFDDEYVFCQGSSLVLDTQLGGGTYNFQWSFGGTILPSETNATLVVNQPGTYSVFVQDFVNDCLSDTSVDVTEIVCGDSDNDMVSDEIEDRNSDANLANDDTDLNNVPDYLDDDDDGDGILTSDEDYNGNGDPTDDDINGNMIPDYLDAEVALSNAEFNLLKFDIYPNPTANMLNIEFNSLLNSTTIVFIYDVSGKLAHKSSHSTDARIEIDVSKLNSGLYFVEIINDNRLTSKKLLIK